MTMEMRDMTQCNVFAPVMGRADAGEKPIEPATKGMGREGVFATRTLGRRLHLFASAIMLFAGTTRVWAFCEEAGPWCDGQAEAVAICEHCAANPSDIICEILNPTCPATNACIEIGVPICHREITELGLAFMRPLLLERVVQTNLHMDHEHFFTQWPHMDGCDFESAVENVNYIYSPTVGDDTFVGLCIPFVHCDNPHEDTRGVIGLLDPGNPRPVDAAAVFGYAMHPIQDVYSHSNWYETFKNAGVAEADIPMIEHTVDNWHLPRWEHITSVLDAHLALIGVDAMMPADEDGYGDDWVVEESGPNVFTVITETGLRIAAFISGTGAAEDECPDDLYFDHSVLNKDSPIMESHDDPADHFAAARLAARQTSHEWCRILHKSWQFHGPAGVSIPMAYWVDPSAPESGEGSPHPAGTPCATSAPGGVEITVSAEEIRILDDTDSEGPGDLNFVLVMFTHDLTRSKRTEINSITANNGDVLGAGLLPGPVTMCLTAEQVEAAAVTLQAWDDDHGPAGQLNPDGDQALLGVYAEISLSALGVHTVASSDMEVTFSIQQSATDTDGDLLAICQELLLGTDPADNDSDDDGVVDGDEVADGTNPLDSDSDDDGLSDGEEADLGTDPLDSDSDDDGIDDGDEVTLGTDPLDSDSDDDGLDDGAEVNDHGTNPLDPDSDDDLLPDGVEVATGLDPLDADSDGDGLVDGRDVEFLQSFIAEIPAEAFQDSGGGIRTSLLATLESVERQLAARRPANAIRLLQNLRPRMDGCGASPDRNDWIVDCEEQVALRELLDLLLENVSSMSANSKLDVREAGLDTRHTPE